jgi:Flp pilus assembly protein TadB
VALSADARKRLVARARQELPEPGDPRLLMDELREAGLAGDEALEVAARSSLAWMQLRDMRLERIWQTGYGWFLARNLIVFGAVALMLFLAFRPHPAVLDGSLAGGALLFIITHLLAPLRLRRHKRRRAGILESYQQDLGEYLDGLER